MWKRSHSKHRNAFRSTRQDLSVMKTVERVCFEVYQWAQHMDAKCRALTAYRTGAKERPSPNQTICTWQPNTVLIGELICCPGTRIFIYQMHTSFHSKRHLSDTQSNQKAHQGPPLVCVSTPAFLTGDRDIELQIIIHFSEHEFQLFHFTSTFKGYEASPNFICKGEYVFYCSYNMDKKK